MATRRPGASGGSPGGGGETPPRKGQIPDSRFRIPIRARPARAKDLRGASAHAKADSTWGSPGAGEKRSVFRRDFSAADFHVCACAMTFLRNFSTAVSETGVRLGIGRRTVARAGQGRKAVYGGAPCPIPIRRTTNWIRDCRGPSKWRTASRPRTVGSLRARSAGRSLERHAAKALDPDFAFRDSDFGISYG